MLLVLPVLYKGRNSFHPESRANFALLAVALLRFKTLHNQCLDRCTTLETVMGFLTLQCLCSTAEHCLFIREASEASTFISFLIDVLWRFIYFPLKHSSTKVEMRLLMPRSQRTIHFFLYKDFVHHICSLSVSVEWVSKSWITVALIGISEWKKKSLKGCMWVSRGCFSLANLQTLMILT